MIRRLELRVPAHPKGLAVDSGRRPAVLCATLMSAASELPLFHVVGFTGHRQLADPAGVRAAITTILGELQREAPGEWIAQSSVAEGADLLFVQTALDLKLGWEAVLPLPLVDFARDFTPERWAEIQLLLNRAEHLEVAAEPGSRDEAYLTGGFEIVNNSDVLLAVWDGQPARGKGGTADVVAYARAMGRPVVILNPESKTVRRENFAELRLHDANLKFLNAVPGAAAAGGPSRDRVAGFQKKVDDAATHSSPHFRRLIALTLTLHVTATALATASLAFGWHWGALPWGKLLCLLGALGVAMIVRFQRTQHNWTRCRLAAEITRSALAIWGLPRATRLFADFDWSGLEPLRRSLDVLHRRAAREAPPDFDTFKQEYLANRIDDQIAYFTRQEAKAIPLLGRLRLGFVVCSVAAIIFTTGYALNLTLGWPELPEVLVEAFFHFSPIMLPVLAAAFISLISINDLHRRVARYREMCIRLEAVRRQIAHSQTWAGLERAIAKAERVLLQEVFEWHSITSFTESH